MIADIGSTPWNIVFLLHILAVVVAFAPAFVWPFMAARARRSGQPLSGATLSHAPVNSMVVHGPALVLVGIFGLLLVVLSGEGVYEFSQVWISIAFVLWFAMLGIVFGLLIPAERKEAAGDEAAGKKVAMFGGILHLLLLLMLIDMIWKPGF